MNGVGEKELEEVGLGDVVLEVVVEVDVVVGCTTGMELELNMAVVLVVGVETIVVLVEVPRGEMVANTVVDEVANEVDVSCGVEVENELALVDTKVEIEVIDELEGSTLACELDEEAAGFEEPIELAGELNVEESPNGECEEAEELAAKVDEVEECAGGPPVLVVADVKTLLRLGVDGLADPLLLVDLDVTPAIEVPPLPPGLGVIEAKTVRGPFPMLDHLPVSTQSQKRR